MIVSVVVCTYNGEKYVKKQLDSLINQSIQIDEIIICDDCSTDNTFKILKAFENSFPERVIIHQNDTRLGPINNFEKAIQICNGDIIFLTDQDDIWYQEKVAKTVDCFLQNPSAIGVFSNASIIDDADNSIIGTTFLDNRSFNNIKALEIGYYNYILKYGNIVAGCCLAFKKEALEYILPFKFKDILWHDEWIALKIASLNKLIFLNQQLTYYRSHELQQVGINYSENSIYDHQQRILFGYSNSILSDYNFWHLRLNTILKLKSELKISTNIVNEISFFYKTAKLNYYSELTLLDKLRLKVKKYFGNNK